MSLKLNIIVSVATQIYVTLVSFLILPLYLKHMGAESYGLVGFFTMLQAWFNLLDMGLTPTITRETARFNGGAIDAISYRRLLRALQCIFFTVAFVGGGVMLLFSASISSQWLNVQALSLKEVQLAVQLTAIVVAMRWMSGLYRGCITGFEQLVWLGGYNTFIATLRFLGALPVMIWVGNSPQVFFSYQLLVAVIEIMGLAAKAHSLFPAIPSGQKLGWLPTKLFKPIKPVLKFSLAIAFTSSVWVLVTQVDKLVLSKLLPLTDYGYFTLAVVAASGVMMVSGPISSALMPHMARIQVEGDGKSLISLYRNATRTVAAIAIPLCMVLSIFPEQVLWAWTGDANAARQAAPILRLYALGNGFLTLAAFPYYLQFAKGDLKLHLIGNAIFLGVLVPSLVWATWFYGAIGAGYAWLGANAIYFFGWLPLVHQRFIKGLHKLWLLHDVGQIALPGILIVGVISNIVILPTNRLGILLWLTLICLITIFILFARMYNFRNWTINYFKQITHHDIRY